VARAVAAVTAALPAVGALVLLTLIDVWIAEPAYNFFPIALGVGATVLAVLTLTSPLAIYGALVLALLLPVGVFSYSHLVHGRVIEAIALIVCSAAYLAACAAWAVSAGRMPATLAQRLPPGIRIKAPAEDSI